MMPPRAARASIGIGALLIVAGILLWRFDGPLDTLIYDDLRLNAARRWLVLLTDAGSGAAMIPVALLGVAWLLVGGRRQAALWLLGTVASGRLVIELAKIEVARVRPDAALHWVKADSASFPSSHSAGSMLTLLALCSAARAPAAAWVASIGFAIAIGLSRVALGVHWPSDVLGGWGFGLLWTGLWAMTARPPSV